MLGGTEEAEASSEMLHRKLHEPVLEWGQRSLPALEGFSRAACTEGKQGLLIPPQSTASPPLVHQPPLLAPGLSPSAVVSAPTVCPDCARCSGGNVDGRPGPYPQGTCDPA